jgi:hypothetical protein
MCHNKHSELICLEQYAYQCAVPVCVWGNDVVHSIQKPLQKKRARGMCTNLDAGARAGAVPFLQHESIGTSCVFTVLYGKAGSVGWVMKQLDQRNASTSEKRGSTTKPKYSHVNSKQHAEIPHGYSVGRWGRINL